MWACLCFLFTFLVAVLHGDDAAAEKLNINELSEKLLFVGLGSSCEAADVLRLCEFRKVAFPFDWMLTSDGKKLIEILENDFSHFTDQKYLAAAKYSTMVLLQTYYHMEFHHEGQWRGDNDYLAQNTAKLVDKYQNRIKRFRQLKDYKGKVFFVRFANKYSLEPNVYYRCKDNLEITEESALLLYDALKKYFPELDFYLVIVNTHRGLELEEEKKLLGRVFMIRANQNQQISIKRSNYTKFFSQLASGDL
jgi:hypothetical protein